MRAAPLLLLLLGGCTSSADQQLAALKSAHSIASEWATVAQLRADGRVSETYARETADVARTELISDRGELTDPGDAAGTLIDGLVGSTPDAARLSAAARRLGDLETAREGR